MIRFLARLFQKPLPGPHEPSWSPADEEFLSRAIRNHQAVSGLYRRRRDATHAQLAREIWGDR